MGNPKISVIVPVYNAERYLHRCMDSILAQTFTDFEVLLIDDGSTDRSGEICSEYGKADGRVHVYYKQNGGVSSARNLGLDKAAGEWITFIDADDYISDDYFDSLNGQNADLVVLHTKIISDFGIARYEAIPVCNIIRKSDLADFLGKYLLFIIMRAPWGKFFRHGLIRDIRFDTSLRLGEDTVFVNTYLLNCGGISVSRGGTYFYFEFEEGKSFCEKYLMSPKECKEGLKLIISSFRKLNIKYPDYEVFMFRLFFPLCWKNMIGQSEVWFRDSYILNLIDSLRPYLRKNEYLMYQLMRISWFCNWYLKMKMIRWKIRTLVKTYSANLK